MTPDEIAHAATEAEWRWVESVEEWRRQVAADHTLRVGASQLARHAAEAIGTATYWYGVEQGLRSALNPTPADFDALGRVVRTMFPRVFEDR